MIRKPIGSDARLRIARRVLFLLPLVLALTLTLTGATAWGEVSVVAQFRLGEEAVDGKIPATVDSAAGPAKLTKHGEMTPAEPSPDARGSKASIASMAKPLGSVARA